MAGHREVEAWDHENSTGRPQTNDGGICDTASEQFEVTFVGVFLDPEHFRWSEPNGFLEGRMVDADTIESCYVRTAADHQNAACQTLKRQK